MTCGSATTAKVVETLGDRGGVIAMRLSNDSVQVVTFSGDLALLPGEAKELRDHLLKLFPIDDMMIREWCDV